MGIEEAYERGKYLYALYSQLEPDSNSLSHKQEMLEFLCYYIL